jgi:hypothetical protein
MFSRCVDPDGSGDLPNGFSADPDPDPTNFDASSERGMIRTWLRFRILERG